MNGIEKITDRIATNMADEVRALEARTQQEAAAIQSGYEALAAQEYEETLAQGKRDAQERIERMGSVAQLEGRKRQLAAKQEMLDKAFDLALEKLLSLPEDQYAALLTKLALRASTTGSEALVFSTTDRARYGKRVVVAANEALAQQGKPAGLTLSEESRPFRGGLYVQNGRVEANCTFATLLRLQRQEMAQEVAGILFD
jgi:V/A-type H+-transporting ATPase subunit E